eukprot:CAMPEP_0113301440 /NCGR_PEP_ID=MMETSP0010_2-20120614/2672_1 /TAXON_ID=216773 ORGANISM="Corethron hystrix, Strain 308" /NCGR_SAMPLE_ID=MMETSP0010_2 /ASSEMBLY_ACC=CAM_ASM_000155 /LENGTH=536 /DNA_ID=CAMNT_0000155071 /DNA_START=717 /DNA_END=2327 /DNA_ORIENTATION=+ /assembly_acc=CAM_ASM_000155
MSDDHALKGISAYDDVHVRTPNIDRIAAEGMRFENAFVTNSLCGPARAVVLTSKYSHINGFEQNVDGTVFDEGQWTFPKALRAGGYYTAIVGKYHLNSSPSGFDYWNVLVGQGQYYQPEFVENGERIVYNDTHVTDKITELTLDVLRHRAPGDRPWMVMMHHKAPHRNWAAPGRYLGRFHGRNFSLPETYFDDYSTRSPAPVRADNKVRDMYWSDDLKLDLGDGPDPGTGGDANHDAKGDYAALLERMTEEQRTVWEEYYGPLSRAFYGANYTGTALDVDKYQRFMRDYVQSVAAVDESVGRVLDHLEGTGELDHTLVVYTSDQGFFLGEHGFYDKRFMYEPSLRTPLLMRYPPLIREGGRVTDRMVLNLDYGATFLDLAGVTVPVDVQGESLVPVMRGEVGEGWRRSIYYHYYEYPSVHSVRRHYGVRTETHKLIKFYGDDVVDGEMCEMYDLVSDPDELVNLYDLPQYGDLRASLNRELWRLQEKYKDTTFNLTAGTPARIYNESYVEKWTKEKINYVMRNMELIGDEEQFLPS